MYVLVLSKWSVRQLSSMRPNYLGSLKVNKHVLSTHHMPSTEGGAEHTDVRHNLCPQGALSLVTRLKWT